MRFIKLGRQIINPNEITVIVLPEDGGGMVNLTGGQTARLKPDEMNLLLGVVAPLGQ